MVERKQLKQNKSEESVLSNWDLFQLLWGFMKPYSLVIFFTLILLPITAYFSAVQPLLIQRAIDGPLLERNLTDFYPILTFYIVSVVLAFVVQIIQTYIINKTGQKVVADIRLALFAHLQRLQMSYFDKNPIGKSVTRITSDMENLSESFASGLINIIADLIHIMAVFAFMFFLNWQLSLALLFMILPMFFFGSLFQTMYRRANLRARILLAKLNSFLQQNIVGISVVQLLNSAEKSMKIFDESNKDFVKANDDSIKADASFSAAVELLALLATAVLIFLSKHLILQTGLSIGVVIAFLQYTQALFEPLKNLSDRFTIIQSGFTAAERISQLLHEPIQINDGTRDIDLESYEIEFKDVWFKYDIKSSNPLKEEEWVLKGLSFKVGNQEKVAIVAKTGAGKSTIIKLLSRLYEAQKGSISINGVDIREVKQKYLRELIAVIHQDSYIFAGNLESNISLNRPEQLVKMDLAKPFLQGLNLSMDTRLDERAGNISAGEEQVISFARAVVSDPAIIVLDEATAKIDLKTEQVLQDSLAKFIQNKTCIVIAHRLETIKRMDRILVINQGQLAEEGNHDELIELNGLYSKLYANRDK